jgi:hypothetical protein
MTLGHTLSTRGLTCGARPVTGCCRSTAAPSMYPSTISGSASRMMLTCARWTFLPPLCSSRRGCATTAPPPPHKDWVKGVSKVVHLGSGKFCVARHFQIEQKEPFGDGFFSRHRLDEFAVFSGAKRQSWERAQDGHAQFQTLQVHVKDARCGILISLASCSITKPSVFSFRID